MNSFDPVQTPKITYVGRLKDSRKGIEIFLDAVELLEQSHRLPIFAVWIVGGSVDDCNWLIRSCSSRPGLSHKLSLGQLQIWGRVENSCLPEIYSRSNIIVMPSLREQLGIVAIEAALCRCPVIASRVGGLRDVVVPEFTGSLSDRGSAAALAGSLSFYLRCTDYGEWQGCNARIWARKNFRASSVYARLERVLLENGEHEHPSPSCDKPKQGIHSTLREEILPEAETITQSKITVVEDLSSSTAISATIQLGKQLAFLKIYPSKPSSFKNLFFPQPSEPRTRIRAVISLLHQLKGKELVPTLLASNLTPPFVIQEFCPPRSEKSLQPATVVEVMESIRSLDPLNPNHPAKRKVVISLVSFAAATLSQQVEPRHLQCFDNACKDLNYELFRVPAATRRMHPQIELIRILQYIQDNAAWLPVDYQLRVTSEIRFCLSLNPIVPAWPQFAHGTFKEEHLLGDNKICDLDHAGYYFGPIDAAHYSWDKFRHEPGPAPRKIVNYLSRLVRHRTDLYLGLCWVLHSQITRDLIAFGQGRLSKHRDTILFLCSWKEVVRGSRITRLEESDGQSGD